MEEFLAEHVWQLITLFVLLVLSGFFSGSETAMFSLSRSQVHRMRHSASGRLVASLLDNPPKLLSTLLLCNMMVNTAYGSMSAVLVIAAGAMIGSARAAGLSVGLLVVLILLGEVLPKSLAAAGAERLAHTVATPVSLLQRVLHPVLWILQHIIVGPLDRLLSPRRVSEPGNITAEELTTMLHLSAKRGVLDRSANTLLQEVFELTDLRVAEVMVPRVDMIAFDINRPRSELEDLFRRSRLRRMPVFDGDIDNIVGLVHAKRVFLSPQTPLRELVVKANFVPLLANIERVLLQLRVMRTQIAIVVDEYGGIAGLITLEDILEEIVGDIPDLHEREYEPLKRVGAHEYIVDGDVGIHDWAEMFNIDPVRQRISTVGGLVTSLLGHIPRVGEQVKFKNMLITIESLRNRRVGTLRIKLAEETA